MIHNLDEGTSEYFEFVLDGKTYKMRYPTTDEVQALDEEEDAAKSADMLYSFIEVPEGMPPFKEILGSANVIRGKNFLKMIRKEFSADF